MANVKRLIVLDRNIVFQMEGLLYGRLQDNEGKCYNYPIVVPSPRERVTLHYVFSYVGVDYAGPVFVNIIFNKKKNALCKSRTNSFICSNSRGICITLAPDCT